MKRLLCFFLFFLFVEVVYAEDSIRFYYNTDQVDGMIVTRTNGTVNKSSSPVIIRRKSDNAYVYCIEPFAKLNQEEDYTVVDANTLLDKEKVERISKLAYFGYMYPGHEDKIWYGITQYLIWKTIAPNASIYFVNKRHGDKIEAFTKEVAELEGMLKNYDYLLSFNNKTLTFDNMKEYEEWFSNLPLDKLKIDSGNEIILPKNKIAFELSNSYYHKSGQNVYLPGNLYTLSINYNIEIREGKIELIKSNKDEYISKDNSLEGAKYGIYQDGLLIDEMVTNDMGVAYSKDLEYGTYIIKEISAPKGYLIDDKEYEVVLNQDRVTLEVEEEQIKNEIRIEKWYGYGKYKLESHAVFEIYQEDILVTTLETSEEGEVIFNLPSGNYRIHQIKGIEGYKYIEDYNFNTDEVNISLYDEKIITNIPSTGVYHE